MSDNLPGKWFEIDAKLDRSEKMYQHSRTGLVISVETNVPKRVGANYQVVTLPENFEDDNDVIQIIASDILTIKKAVGRAKDYMELNPEGKLWNED